VTSRGDSRRSIPMTGTRRLPFVEPVREAAKRQYSLEKTEGHTPRQSKVFCGKNQANTNKVPDPPLLSSVYPNWGLGTLFGQRGFHGVTELTLEGVCTELLDGNSNISTRGLACAGANPLGAVQIPAGEFDKLSGMRAWRILP